MLYGSVALGALIALDVWHSLRSLRREREAQQRIEAIKRRHIAV
jgi:hypothetical protein